MKRSVPISFAEPNAAVENAELWREIGKLANANPEFTPLELKAFYVIGLIEDICRSVEWLLCAKDAWQNKYLPAFSVFSSAVDLFGRCLTGNTTADSQANLAVGFQYLANPTSNPPAKTMLREDQDKNIVITTNNSKYSISNLIDLRHYSSHGQATIKAKLLPSLDIELLDSFPRLFSIAMETYWAGLLTNVEYCKRLGNSLIAAYGNRAEPMRDTIAYFAQPGQTIGDLFAKMDWQINN